MNDPHIFLEPLGGYLTDTWRKLRGEPFVPHSLTKLQNILIAKHLSGSREAIEVGTYKGITTRRLSRYFDKVVSIEISESLIKIATRRCASRKNIDFILGDGKLVLPQVCAAATNALVYLDGHYSGPGTGCGDELDPVLSELDIIADAQDRIKAIVIDDFRTFGQDRGLPPKSQIFACLERRFPVEEWVTRVMYDQVLVYKAPQ